MATKYKQAATVQYGETVMNEAEERQKGKEEIVADGFNNISSFASADNIEKGPTSNSYRKTWT